MPRLRFSLALTLAAVLLVISFRYFSPAAAEAFAPTAGEDELIIEIPMTVLIERLHPAGSSESPDEPEDVIVSVNVNGTLKEMTVEDYIFHVVAGEMPVSYESEALKAQAVAARTYLYYKIAIGGCKNGGDICTDSHHCQAFRDDERLKADWGDQYKENAQKIRDAVDATRGEVILYNGKPVCALYHSSSLGTTEDCSAVFGTDLPYLVRVSSPDRNDVKELYRTVTFTEKEFVQKLADAGIDVSSCRVTVTGKTDAGRASSVSVDGKNIPATVLRKALGLRSTDFTVTSAKASVTFATRGFGHGVGMSQLGAQCMAEDGLTYREILTHYYSGTTVERI